MPEILEALILGIVQGLTEFLPVSSSGHLELIKFLLNDESVAQQSMLTTVILHFATALATIIVFKDDIIEIVRGLGAKNDNSSRRFALLIILSMIPAVLLGLFMEDFVAQLFNRQILLVGICLCITALLLYVSERLEIGKGPLTGVKAFLIGMAQAIAILPGISRSGATIATGLMLGIEKQKAARFSFLMVVPLIFGKMGKDILSGDLMVYRPDWLYLLAGFTAALLSGIWACRFMLDVVKNSRLHWFAIYCAIIGAIAIFAAL